LSFASLEPVPDCATWPSLFFQGRRLEAEVRLQAAAFRLALPAWDQEMAFLQRSYGWPAQDTALSVRLAAAAAGHQSIGALHQRYQQGAGQAAALRQLVLDHPAYPDPLLYWGLSQSLAAAGSRAERQHRFRRLGRCLLARFPQRADLLLQLIAAETAYAVLKSLPDQALPASAYYANTHCALFHLQALWAKGRYNALHLTYSHYALQRRHFPSSDFLLRTYTILGRIERAAALFRAIHQRHHQELQITTVSNMLFTELGLEQLDLAHLQQLVADYRRLSQPSSPAGPLLPAPQPLVVQERPTLAVVSADLRMHPVGRFWLPLARALHRRYRLVHIAFNPGDQDRIRDELKDLSTDWHGFDTGDDPLPLLQTLQPDLLLDLGGHTADNRPGLLNHRLAPVQATYLGFYGPSYGLHCDWWVLDAAVARRVARSYPESEPIWTLPGPSLCFDPDTHGLPALEALRYSEPDHAVFGCFNHTRKLTDACIHRFAAVLHHNPEATLLFRSHSFYDQAVRRWFLRQFVLAGAAAHQLQPIPYAPSAADSLLDYGRTHLHLDSYPVCGTTTTLDALAMGVPVLTCPNHLYAGAISAALIEQAGFADWVVEDPAELPARAAALAQRYRTAAARRALAAQVRCSPVCDTTAMPAMFADQLAAMLRAAHR
jgi:predicted O-linked N-acetylglucosamine transferase (SPINDLY family)